MAWLVAVLRKTRPSKPAFRLEATAETDRRATLTRCGGSQQLPNGLTSTTPGRSGSAVILRGLQGHDRFRVDNCRIAPHESEAWATGKSSLFLPLAAHHSFLSSSVVEGSGPFSGGDVAHMRATEWQRYLQASLIG